MQVLSMVITSSILGLMTLSTMALTNSSLVEPLSTSLIMDEIACAACDEDTEDVGAAVIPVPHGWVIEDTAVAAGNVILQTPSIVSSIMANGLFPSNSCEACAQPEPACEEYIYVLEGFDVYLEPYLDPETGLWKLEMTFSPGTVAYCCDAC